MHCGSCAGAFFKHGSTSETVSAPSRMGQDPYGCRHAHAPRAAACLRADCSILAATPAGVGEAFATRWTGHHKTASNLSLVAARSLVCRITLMMDVLPRTERQPATSFEDLANVFDYDTSHRKAVTSFCRTALYSTHGLEHLECKVHPFGITAEATVRRCPRCPHWNPDRAPHQEAAWPLPHATPQLHLFKLRGDRNVPAGHFSIVADLTGWHAGWPANAGWLRSQAAPRATLQLSSERGTTHDPASYVGLQTSMFTQMHGHFTYTRSACLAVCDMVTSKHLILSRCVCNCVQMRLKTSATSCAMRVW